jgi:small subunit ribosomal protein S4
VPSFQVVKGDVVELREGSRKNALIQANLDTAQGRGIPPWLELDGASFKGRVVDLPRRDDIQLPITESLIVELYSK